MNRRSLRILEYNKIIDMLVPYADSPMGKRLCKHLFPSSDREEIVRLQEETGDALTRIYQKGSVTFSGVTDIGLSLKRLEVGATLSTSELLDLARLLDNALSVRQYGVSDDDLHEPDCLDSRFLDLMPLEHISREIRRCILSADEIADDASSDLKALRRAKKQINEKIHTQLLNIVNSQNNRTLLQDSLITMRNGRYCIPVKQEYRSSFPGMIHDQSSSGSTLFIEPMSVVNLNNELKELENKEQLEIERILASISEQAAFELTAIQCNIKLLTELDFIFARAKFAKSYLGTRPIFNDHGYINIKQGRHPLLDPKTVVPIDLTLGDTYQMLIVTGPNTGGKTVSLKTVGLFTLMGQSGLHIPAFEGSELCVFRDVFADIGDEQSIEQNLSTFSSHMSNIVYIIQHAAPDTLVLFDELNGGTDPIEGAALAIAILRHLHAQGILCIATTHYSELKTFALSTEGIENASCEFDVASLRPTYRLRIGIPGKSNAFAISKKLGLPDYIIDDAKTHLESNDEAFEDLLANLEQSRVTIEKEREEIASYKEEISRLKKNIEQKEERLDERKEKLLKNANEEAQRILREAKETADQTIRNINKLAASSGVGKELEAERTKLREKLDKVDKNLSLKNNKGPKKTISPKKLKIGDGVKVLTMNLKGTVSTLPNAKGDLYVQMGILRSLVNIKDLELLDEASVSGPGLDPAAMKRNNTGSGKIKMAKSFSVSPEVNLIGMTTDEAMPVLDKYLDDAYLAHLPQVRVVHGRGTGALRAAVHKHLKKLKYVKEFRLGESEKVIPASRS